MKIKLQSITNRYIYFMKLYDYLHQAEDNLRNFSFIKQQLCYSKPILVDGTLKISGIIAKKVKVVFVFYKGEWCGFVENRFK